MNFGLYFLNLCFIIPVFMTLWCDRSHDNGAERACSRFTSNEWNSRGSKRGHGFKTRHLGPY